MAYWMDVVTIGSTQPQHTEMKMHYSRFSGLHSRGPHSATHNYH